MVLNMILHLIIPTQCPNDPKNLSESWQGRANNAFFAKYFSGFSGVVAMPSPHVSLSVLPIFFALIFGLLSIKTALLSVWGILIIISTMTTKQHYIFDVWTGILAAFVSVVLCKLILS